jgi:type II secretory pathway pseudopilin PulG
MPTKRIAIFKHGPGTQRGAALLIMLVLLVVGIAAMLINSLTTVATKNARQEKTAAALSQAKEALIGFAITYGDNPAHSLPQVDGYLPCPDTSGSPEGSTAPPCGSKDVSVIGRLPWRTLGLPALRDGDGECLWYAVSGTYKDSPKTGLMNWDTNGQLQAYAPDGTLLTPADNQVVAVIFAPGAALSGQDRSGTTAQVCKIGRAHV